MGTPLAVFVAGIYKLEHGSCFFSLFSPCIPCIHISAGRNPRACPKDTSNARQIPKAKYLQADMQGKGGYQHRNNSNKGTFVLQTAKAENGGSICNPVFTCLFYSEVLHNLAAETIGHGSKSRTPSEHSNPH